jgi:hypothetical protein
MSLFGRGASPFQVPDLKRKDIEKLIRNATIKTLDLYVSPPVLQQIASFGFAIQNCAAVITNLLRVIDDYASHTHPVYKALYIMVYCLHSSHRDHFAAVCRALVPEIAAVLYLSFDANSAPFRDRIHCMASAICHMLMYDAPLPRPDAFGENWVKVTHRAAPPPETDRQTEVVSFVEAATDQPLSDENEELDFDPRALPPTLVRKLERITSTDDLLWEPTPSDETELVMIETPPIVLPQAPELAPPQPPNEDDIQPGPKTAQDLLSLMQLMVIRRVRYDDDIESC